MGNKYEKHSTDTSDEEEPLTRLKRLEDYSRECCVPNSYIKSEAMVYTDATSSPELRKFPSFNLTKRNVEKIARNLNHTEKISLIFLLSQSDDVNSVENLKLMESVEATEFKKFLYGFNKSSAGSAKILEALTLIQDYHLLKLLGFSKEEMQSVFLPNNFTFYLYISKLHRLLYKIADNLEPSQEQQLMHLLKSDLKSKEFKVPNFEMTEMYFTYCFATGYINSNDVSNLAKNLKRANLLTHYSFLGEFCGTNLNVKTKIESLVYPDDTAQSSSKCTTRESTDNLKSTQKDDETYNMDPLNPGICLIIENEFFYDEFEEDKEKVVTTPGGITPREGTEHDSTKLRDIFARFGYIINYHENKTHDQIKDIIKQTCHVDTQENYSSLVVILLSHGINGSILASNNIPVEIEEMKKLTNSKQLEEKPKIMIVQACQGTEIQKIHFDDDVQLDCISQPLKPSRKPYMNHFITLFATVPGSAAFRNVNEGTWLIQDFVEVLEKNSKEQFTEICTKVLKNIASRVNHKTDKCANVMVPEYRSTLMKRLYLPPLKKKI